MLFDKYRIDENIVLKNRIVLPPMCICACFDESGRVNKDHIAHYGIRAILGVGMVIVEATAVEKEGRITKYDLGLWNDDQIDGMKDIVDILHRHNTVAAIQISHAGRKALHENVAKAPSNIKFNEKDKDITVLENNEVYEIINKFVEASYRAQKAGFDAVEFHGAHGYLINQFLSPLSNKRDDEFGGSFENRFRFLQLIIEKSKKVFKGSIFVRLSAEEYIKEGLHIDDHIEIAKKLEKIGVTYIDVSSGGIAPHEYNTFPLYQVPLSEKIKKNVNVSVSAVGLITEPKDAEQILIENKADLIQIGRQLLREPTWISRAANELNEMIELPYPYGRVF